MPASCYCRHAPRSREDQEIGVGERQAGGKRGKVGGAAAGAAIAVVDEPATHRVVNDVVVGILCMRAFVEHPCEEDAGMVDLSEDHVAQVDLVDARMEVGNAVHIV